MTSYVCSDTDTGPSSVNAVRGINYTAQGTARSTGTGTSLTDRCVTENGIAKIQEYYCYTQSARSPSSVKKVCSDVVPGTECNAGACVSATICGNGVKEGAEQCDAGASNGAACAPEYGSTCTYCDVSCLEQTVRGPYCGDLVVNGQEQCDGTDLGSATCDAGQTGAVSCTNTCILDKDGCFDSTTTVPTCAIIYDEFSGNSLDVTKWQETAESDSGTDFVSEHGVRNGAYHTAQNEAANRAVNLITTRSFASGEIFEYDIFYSGGSGNRLSRIYFDGSEEDLPINERYLDVRLARQGYGRKGFATSGDIGYWNGESEVGNVVGKYHVKVDFLTTNTTVTLTNPLRVSYSFMINLSLPARVGFSTKTGHDGTVQVNYDTAYTLDESCMNPPPQVSSGSSLVVVDATGKEVGIFNRISASSTKEQANEVVVFDTNIQAFNVYDWYTGNFIYEGGSGDNRQIQWLGSYSVFFETSDCTDTAYALPWTKNIYTIIVQAGDPIDWYYRIPNYESINLISSDMLHSKWTTERISAGECVVLSTPEPKNGKTMLTEITPPSYPGPLSLVVR